MKEETKHDILRDKHDIVREMFVATADKNYILARLAFSREFYEDFFWLSLHALEKYFKAILLLNDKSAKESHNLENLYDKVQRIRTDLDFGGFVEHKAKWLQWRPHTVIDYIRLLDDLGSPDNRYLVHGHFVRLDDLLKVDQIIWSVRRHCRPFKAEEPSADGQLVEIVDWVDRLRRDRRDWSLGEHLPIERLLAMNAEDPLRCAFMWNNTAFVTENPLIRVEWVEMGTASPLLKWVGIVKQNALPREQKQDIRAVLKWACDNIKLPRSMKSEIEDALKA